MQKLETGEEQYKDFRATAPLMWKGGEGTNLHQERQAKIEIQRAEIQLQISEIKSNLDSVEAAMERGGDVGALALLAQRMYPGANAL